MDTFQNCFQEQKHLKVLEKYINLFLFGNVITPDFPPDEKLAIDQNLIKMLENHALVVDSKADIIFENYLQKFYAELKEKLDDDDLINLMKCYGNSNFRSVLKIASLLKENDKKNKDCNLADDDRILNDLLWEFEGFPKEILSYMYLQFSDILIHVDIETKVITKKEYCSTIEKYKIDCNYEDIVKQFKIENLDITSKFSIYF